MARAHGRNGALYAAISSGGTAQPVAFLSAWTFASTSDRVDVTAFGDSNKTYVAGLPDASGSFEGFWDSDGVDLYTASQDGVARKFYLYPDRSNYPTDYWYGTAFFDFEAAGGVTDAVTVSGSWSAASTIARINT